MSMPWVGSSKMKTSAPVSIHLASTIFCWLPPERWRAGCSTLATLLTRGALLFARAGNRRRPDQPEFRHRGQGDVFADREGEDAAVAFAVLGQQHDPGVDPIARAADLLFGPAQEDLAFGGVVGAVDQ